jgi:hypothetical protein
MDSCLRNGKLQFSQKLSGKERWHMSVILSTRKVEIGGTAVQGQSGKKVRSPSQQTIWEWLYIRVISVIWEVQVGGS